MEWSCHYCLFSQEQYKLAHFSHHLWKRGDPSSSRVAPVGFTHFTFAEFHLLIFHLPYIFASLCTSTSSAIFINISGVLWSLWLMLTVHSRRGRIAFGSTAGRTASRFRHLWHVVRSAPVLRPSWVSHCSNQRGKRLFPPWFKYIAQFGFRLL